MDRIITQLAAEWPVYLGALFFGCSIGMLTSLFGAGGGFIITPVLRILFGLDMPAAASTSAFHILGTSSLSIFQKRKHILETVFVALALIAGDIPGVKVGDWLLKKTANIRTLDVFGREVMADDFVAYAVLGAILAAVITWLVYDNFIARHAVDPDDRPGLFARIKLPPMAHFKSITGPFSVTILLAIGFVVGFLAGLLGIGGGVIILPVLVYLVGQRTVQAARTDLLLVWVSALMKVFFGWQQVNIVIGCTLLLGAVFGTKIGSVIQERISGKGLRRWFCLIVGVALTMIVGELWKMFH